jgi:hypothetical protein
MGLWQNVGSKWGLMPSKRKTGPIKETFSFDKIVVWPKAIPDTKYEKKFPRLFKVMTS